MNSTVSIDHLLRGTGQEYEKAISKELTHMGYTEVPPLKFKATTQESKPTFARQFHAGKTIYGRRWRIDFMLYHPQLWPDCLGIESKFQVVNGTASEKIPKTCEDIENNNYKTLMVVAGPGFDHGVYEFLRQKIRWNSMIVGVVKDLASLADYLAG